jgi:hypothetical protein
MKGETNVSRDASVPSLARVSTAASLPLEPGDRPPSYVRHPCDDEAPAVSDLRQGTVHPPRGPPHLTVLDPLPRLS